MQDDTNTPPVALTLAQVLRGQGRLDEAQALARQAWSGLSKGNPNPGWDKSLAAELLGDLHYLQAARPGKCKHSELDAARSMYRAALGGADTYNGSGWRELLGDKHRCTLAAARGLEKVLQAMEPPDPFHQLDDSGTLKSMGWPRGVEPEAVRQAEKRAASIARAHNAAGTAGVTVEFDWDEFEEFDEEALMDAVRHAEEQARI